MGAVGVDIGTTFTAAAIAHDTSSESVLLGERSATIPTVVHIRRGESLVGDAALARAANDPDGLARGFKRLFGREDPLQIGGTSVHVETLMTTVLEWVLATVASREGAPSDAVALTHPANWSEYRLDLLRSCARSAGIAEPILLPEPCAAARFLASTDRVPPDALIAVYDFGGGTLDATVVRMTSGGIEVMGSPTGDERLGGLDIDQALLDHVTAALGTDWGTVDADDPEARRGLRALEDSVAMAKELLSEALDADVPVTVGALRTDVRITRGELEQAVRPLIDRSVDRLTTAIESVGVTPADLHAVLLVGGSSRIPLVARVVQDRLGTPIRVDAHPKLAIARGAALAAAGQEIELVDGDPLPADTATDDDLLPQSVTLAPRMAERAGVDTPDGGQLPDDDHPPGDDEAPVPVDEPAVDDLTPVHEVDDLDEEGKEADPLEGGADSSDSFWQRRPVLIGACAVAIIIVGAVVADGLGWFSGGGGPDEPSEVVVVDPTSEFAQATMEFVADPAGGIAAEDAVGDLHEAFGATPADPVPTITPTCDDAAEALTTARTEVDAAMSGSPDAELARRYDNAVAIHERWYGSCDDGGEPPDGPVPDNWSQRFTNAATQLQARLDGAELCSGAAPPPETCEEFAASAAVAVDATQLEGRPWTPIVVDGDLWVPAQIDGEGHLTRLDPDTGATESVALGTNSAETPLHTDDRIWVASTSGRDDQVAIVDTTTLEASTTSAGFANWNPVSTGQAVWIVNRADGSLTRIDMSDPASTIDFALGSGEPSSVDIVAVEDQVFVTSEEDGSLWRFDDDASGPDDGDRFELDGAPNGIAFGFGSLWVPLAGTGTVVRLEIGDQAVEVLATIPVGEGPTRPIVTADAIWVPNSGDGTVTRIDPETNEATGSVDVGGRPVQGTAVDDDAYVTSWDTGTFSALTADADGTPRLDWQIATSVGSIPRPALAFAGDLWVPIDETGELLRVTPPESGEG